MIILTGDLSIFGMKDGMPADPESFTCWEFGAFITLRPANGICILLVFPRRALY
jgi:hypothetical protein